MKCFAVMVLRTCNFHDHDWGWSNHAETWMLDSKMFSSEKSAERAMLDSFRGERMECDRGYTLDNSTARFKILGNADRIYGVELWNGDIGDSGQIKMSWRVVELEGESVTEEKS